MAERPLSAYDGDEAYIFVTWAHEDTALVLPQIRWLQDQGFNVWWDEGISPGAAWRAEIADAISGCSLLLYFITPQSVVSEHCNREVSFGLDEHHRPVLAVHLVETALPGALALSLSDRQAILQYALQPADYERKLATAVATYLEQPLTAIAPGASNLKRARQIPLRLAVAACLLVAVGVTVFAAWLLARDEPPEMRPVSRFALDLPPGVSLPYAMDLGGFDMSRDGRRIVFSGVTTEGSQFYVRSLDTLDAKPIVGTEGAGRPSLSPDGESIIFRDRNGTLKKVPVDGGRAVTIVQNIGFGTGGLSWARDGTVIYAPNWGDPLMRISENGGTPEPVSEIEEDQFHRHPHLLADGSAVLFSVISGGPGGPSQVAVLSFVTGEQRILTEGSFPLVTSSGHLLFLRDGKVWAMAFDTDRLGVSGVAVPVLDNITASQLGQRRLSVAEDGSMVYAPPRTESRATLVWVNLEGEEVTLPVSADFYLEPRVSPDGSRVAVRVGPDDTLWIHDLGRHTAIKLTEVSTFSPLWSPDSEKVIYMPTGGGPMNLYSRSADGTGVETRLTTSPRRQFATSWSSDGNEVLYFECDTDDCDLGRLSLAKGNIAELILDTEHDEVNPKLSPDGQWVAYESNRSGRVEIYVRPYPDLDSGFWKISTHGGIHPLWSPDGSKLYYTIRSATGGYQMMAVAIEAAGGLEAGDPQLVFEYVVAHGFSSQQNHDLHPNGEQFLMARHNDRGNRLIRVENWSNEVERIVQAE